MSKRLANTPHPDAWIWEQLQRMLSSEEFQFIRQGYQDHFRAYLLSVGPIPEEMVEIFEEQLKAANLDLSTTLDGIRASRMRTGEEQAASDNAAATSSSIPGDPSSCGICKNLPNHNGDWLCWGCREEIDHVFETLRVGNRGKALIAKTRQIMRQAGNYVELITSLGEGWQELVGNKQYRAEIDRADMMPFVRSIGRPRDAIYDDAYNLIRQQGYTKREAYDYLRTQDKEIDKIPFHTFATAVNYRLKKEKL